MELGQIEAFLAVARTASFTRAGHELPLSQPALSRRIGALEGRLGVALFERGRHGARLTEAGVRLRPFAEAIVAATRAGAIAARRPHEPPANTITIGLVSSMLSTRLASALAEFRADHRRLRVHIRTATSDGVSALVRQGEARMGLRFLGDPDPALVCRPVRDEALCVVGARGHRLAGSPERALRPSDAKHGSHSIRQSCGGISPRWVSTGPTTCWWTASRLRRA